ncbi:hypothetical protein [Pseudolysinimonas sp.]|uniref:hypothetical protein n=1 Tax=Pseudolysinimonas sp. TaxID=2680009 RepID=UPI00286AD101|nr:hypothetical protein [Pseudolysinimonas sp.]
MAVRSALAAATDLDAVLVGRWVPPPAVRRAATPCALVLAAALALLPLALGSGSLVFGLLVGGVLAAGAVGIFVFVMSWQAGSRLIGYSPRGVFLPDIAEVVRWDRIVRVHTGASTSRSRVISIELSDVGRMEVAVPSTITEPEYRAFLGALAGEAEARNVPMS